MAHILYKLGEAALRPRGSAGQILPPLISYDQAMHLRSQFYREQQAWPYEHIVPGPPKMPPGTENYLERKEQKNAVKQARLKEIQDAMAKMPTLISQYKESRKMDWDEVDAVDQLTMNRTAIKRKYLKKRMTKQQ